ISPMIGNDLRNWMIIEKKSPNKFRIPKNSIIKPINVHFINKIKKIPEKKQILPLLLFCLVKKTTVLFCPIIKNIPIRNSILPLASNALSKNVNIPKVISIVPITVKPVPNF
ncbi:hypothetical protein HANVADRAFT_22814, partial [Hanseniaspora valbyensis NRRL Y-1626]